MMTPACKDVLPAAGAALVLGHDAHWVVRVWLHGDGRVLFDRLCDAVADFLAELRPDLARL